MGDARPRPSLAASNLKRAGSVGEKFIPSRWACSGRFAAWERGRPARRAALGARRALILAFSHKGRRDPLTAIHGGFGSLTRFANPASP